MWNHRVIRTQEGNDPDNPLLLRLVEVHYRDETPIGYSECFMCGDDIAELQGLVERLRIALEQPILDEADFPAPAKYDEV